MNKKVILGIGGAVVVGGVGVAVAVSTLGGGDEKQRTFANPQERLQYVLEESGTATWEAVSTSVSNYSNMLKESAEINQMASLDLEVGEGLTSMLSAMSPAFGDLKNVGLRIDTTGKGMMFDAKFLANVNEQDIASMNMHVDIENQKGYFRIPELSDAYLDFSSVFTMEDSEFGDMEEFEQALDQIMGYIPEEETIKNLFGFCTDIFWKNVGEVTEASEVIKAKDVEETCTAITMSIDGADLYNIFDAFITEVPNNQDIKEVITKIDEDAYTSFLEEIESINESKEEMKEEMTSSDFKMDLVWYVSAKNELRGVKLYMVSEDEDVELYCVAPEKGTDFGYLCYGKVSDKEALRIDGIGSIVNNKMNADYALSISDEFLGENEMIPSGENLLEFSVTDYDVKAAEKGYINAKVKVYTKAVPMLEQFALEFDSSMSEKEENLSMAVLMNDETMLTLKLKSAEGEKVESCVPGEDDKVYDVQNESDMEAFESEIDLEGFVNDITDKIGISLDELEDLF